MARLTTAVVFLLSSSIVAVVQARTSREGFIESGPALNNNDVHVHIEWVPILSRRNASDLMKDAFQEVIEDDEDEAPRKIHRIGDMLSKSYDTIERDIEEGKDRLDSLAINKSADTSGRTISVIISMVTYCLHLLIFS
ncbi:hypothetical protein QR680_015432 [Steinernema hermaphroditum]|uniref:Uncharacterized protein n=1 Tax=Steinernema hermaphroditum TaxID=289476 RepID=A0AA39LKT4_9BILA|nr:hypothetical protein QR680_015432 [Steinernema hermaphroditum]